MRLRVSTVGGPIQDLNPGILDRGTQLKSTLTSCDTIPQTSNNVFLIKKHNKIMLFNFENNLAVIFVYSIVNIANNPIDVYSRQWVGAADFPHNSFPTPTHVAKKSKKL